MHLNPEKKRNLCMFIGRVEIQLILENISTVPCVLNDTPAVTYKNYSEKRQTIDINFLSKYILISLIE